MLYIHLFSEILVGLFNLMPVINFKRNLTIYAFFFIAESAVRFDGKGYLKYLYRIEEGNKNFHLSLRLKTSAAEGTVMSTNASDWGTLEVQHFSNTLTKESLTYSFVCHILAQKAYFECPGVCYSQV